MICQEHKKEFKSLLKRGKLKATSVRLNLLEIFAHNRKPVCVSGLKDEIGKSADLATVYRNAEILTRAGVLQRVRLQDKKDYYELAGGPHHHHLVCTHCGKISDIGNCAVKPVSVNILKQSGFAKITNHQLEFFGLCQQCTN